MDPLFVALTPLRHRRRRLMAASTGRASPVRSISLLCGSPRPNAPAWSAASAATSSTGHACATSLVSPETTLTLNSRSLCGIRKGMVGIGFGRWLSVWTGIDYDEEHRLSPVLYREKLVKDFNYRGFLNFRNLAKMSRPKKKKKKLKDGKEDGLEVKRGVGKNDFAVVEVVGDGGVGEEEDMSGLLGEGFGMGRWRGPTRLLLLDERYAKKGADELPDAIKAVLQGCATMGKLSVAELVQCRLTLFYDYWHMNEVMAYLSESVVSSYWNSRLGSERIRLVDCFTSSDVVCDVFSGVGPIAISAAKKVKHVYANDLNPIAVDYLERNVVLSKLERKVQVFNMDGRRFLSTVFTGQRCYPVTQAVMNLPNDAVEFLDVFRGIFGSKLKADNCPLPKIHVYGFSKAENPEFDFHERINIALGEKVTQIGMHRVRLVAPGKWMLCGSFILPHSVAFAKVKTYQD
ncbi:hypothetical protein J5N97_011725 [Dioscorea zingiberensis]|uniref:SAM-dependent methyltransferase TRM5/TYW2-type domain-containing protein n=1 Tax=Dioscorea zingiberensis TaxID=325984 RepID=A0A9D5D3L5_9LILI|nr:hypothetical protein J5N97_011725 [Dioscorea zingiberensis]